MMRNAECGMRIVEKGPPDFPAALSRSQMGTMGMIPGNYTNLRFGK